MAHASFKLLSPHTSYYSRRRFLVAVSALALASRLQSPRIAIAAPRSLPDAADASKLGDLLSADELSILSYASLAPSGHNTQPWIVHVMERGRWKIGTNRQHWLPAVDPANRETTLSIGAFLEKLIVAAQRFGYAVEYRVIAGAATDPHLLDLHLRRSSAVDYPLARLQTRRTLRSGYANEPIRNEDLQGITDGSAHFLYFARDTQPARYLSEGTIEANRRQAFRDPAQEELANWIRWSKKDQEKFRNGLTPAGMEINGIAGWVVSTFYDRDSALKKSFRDKGVEQVVQRVAQGAGWLVQTGDPGVSGWIETGRKFQRMWLKLREHAIAIHPMTQLLEETPRLEDVTKELGVAATPQFLLRIGYVKTYPDPVSPRMPVSWFTSSA